LTLKEALMENRPFSEMPCAFCSKPVDLNADLSADENSKAVHDHCYFEHITSAYGSRRS